MIGQCFKSNGEFFLKNAGPGWRLCHGVVINGGDGLPMVHPWIELNLATMVLCLDFEANTGLEKSEYYDAGKIDEVVRYRLDDFRGRIVDSGDWGPWDIKTDPGR